MDKPLAVIPHNAQELAGRIDRLAASSAAVAVIDRVGFQAAAETLRSVKSLAKQLEDMRTSVTQPLNMALRTVNDWFREPGSKLALVEGKLKTAMGTFEATERARIKAEEETARRRAQEEQEELQRRAARAAEKGQADKATELQARAAAVVPEAPATAPVKAKGMGFGEKWTYTITDEAAIPREYLMVDHSKIRGVVNAMKGATKIPGVSVQSAPHMSARAGA